MSKSSTATAPKTSTQLPTKSAWAKGPPQSSAPSPRSQSPAPNNASTQPTHSRRPSTLGQGVPIKDGVSVPRSNVGVVKQGSAVTFGSIDDVTAPISSSPASTPAIKSEGVKSFGTVPATAGHINGKSSVSLSRPALTPSSASIPPVSTPATPSKIDKMDIRKLFQGSSSTSPSIPSSDSSSPSVRPSTLPPQQSMPPQSSQHSQPPPSSQPQFGTHSYPSFVPSSGMRPPQQNSGPGGVPGSGPRSPVYSRQMPNGNGPRPPGGPNGPGGPPQMSGMSSPRLGPHPHQGPPSGLPPPQPVPVPGWPGYYYPPVQPDPYMSYSPQWYMPPQQPLPHQQHPQHPHQQPPPTQQSPMHSTGMPMSPRNQPSLLQGAPSTPTPVHAVSNSIHSPLPSSSHLNNSNNYSSPPPTPSTATARLNTNASAFVPGGARKVTIKSSDGTELNLENLSSKKQSPAAQPPSTLPGTANVFQSAGNRKSVIRMETEEARKKRLAEEEGKLKEAERVKAEADERERKEKEAKARKEKEEEERLKKEEEEREKERVRKEEEEKERIRKEEEERQERIRKEEEEKERIRKEEEEVRRKAEEEERQRLLKAEEDERLRKEEEERERIRIEEEQAAKAKAEAEADAQTLSEQPEEGEVEDQTDEVKEEVDEAKDVVLDVKEDPKKEILRIDTVSIPPLDTSRRRPGPLDLSYANKTNVAAPPPSALATARLIEDLGRVSYPEGVKSPKSELNINAKDGKFRYDRDFLLQFMSICKEKPDMLPPLDAIGLEPSDQSSYSMSRGGSGRHRQASNAAQTPSGRGAPVGLGFNSSVTNPFNVGGMGNMGSFATPGATKMSSSERFAMSNSGRAASVSGAAGLPFGRPQQMQRTASQGGAGGTPMSSNRTRSKRGVERGNENKSGGGQKGHGSSFNNNAGPSGSMGPGSLGLEPVAPLEKSQNAWAPASISRKPAAVDPDSPEIVDRKVKGLLNKLTMEKFDSISDQIIAWANKSEKEKDGRTLIQVIRLVFEKATDEAAWSEMYARLCRKMMEQISPKVQDDGIKNNDGKPIAGGQLFRKYLLNRCQEDFERGWVAKEATAAAAATKVMEDQAAKAANEKSKDGESEDEIVLYSDEYYAAQKAKRQGLGLIKFIGELFKLQMLTERIMHECVKKLLGNVENPEEEEIESLCKLLTTVGLILDTPKARAHMDVYFSRMKELTKSANVSSRMQFMLQDVIELRERRWVTRNAVAAPTTIAQIHETAAKEKAAQDKESYQRQMSMSRGGSRRGGERGGDFGGAQVGPDGWTLTGVPRPPPKAGDLTNFGKISKAAPMTFGPGSVFAAGKKESKRESLSRTNSNSNMFQMLSQNPEAAVESSKPSRPSSRKTSVDLTQSGVPEVAPQRKRLILQPRSKPTPEETNPASESDASEEEEDAVEGDAEISEEEAKKKIVEDSKEFFGVRNLDEAEVYFSTLPVAHHFRLIDKLVSSAIESKEADAQLVADFFSRAASKELCSPAAFEEGFLIVAEILDDIAIDAPKAFDLMAKMIDGSGLDEERRTNIASKSIDSQKLLDLLS